MNEDWLLGMILIVMGSLGIGIFALSIYYAIKERHFQDIFSSFIWGIVSCVITGIGIYIGFLQ